MCTTVPPAKSSAKKWPCEDGIIERFSQPKPSNTQCATGAYTTIDHTATNATKAPNFQRSAVEPVISAGVMIANVNWNATNTIVGNVCAEPSTGQASPMCLMNAKCRSPRYLPSPPNAQVNPTTSHVTLTTAIAAKFCISMASTCLTRTMP